MKNLTTSKLMMYLDPVHQIADLTIADRIKSQKPTLSPIPEVPEATAKPMLFFATKQEIADLKVTEKVKSQKPTLSSIPETNAKPMLFFAVKQEMADLTMNDKIKSQKPKLRLIPEAFPYDKVLATIPSQLQTGKHYQPDVTFTDILEADEPYSPRKC